MQYAVPRLNLVGAEQLCARRNGGVFEQADLLGQPEVFEQVGYATLCVQVCGADGYVIDSNETQADGCRDATTLSGAAMSCWGRH